MSAELKIQLDALAMYIGSHIEDLSDFAPWHVMLEVSLWEEPLVQCDRQIRRRRLRLMKRQRLYRQQVPSGRVAGRRRSCRAAGTRSASHPWLSKGNRCLNQ